MQGLETKASAKQKGIDLIQRTLIITIYLVMTKIATLMGSGLYLGQLVEIFMFSILNAYFCYEYKTTMMEMDLISSIGYFEAQWAYFCGFGSFFTVLLYLFKDVGSSLFFLVFPIMVIISLDE
jgi:etoposide-induced 2.4 mRNA